MGCKAAALAYHLVVSCPGLLHLFTHCINSMAGPAFSRFWQIIFLRDKAPTMPTAVPTAAPLRRQKMSEKSKICRRLLSRCLIFRIFGDRDSLRRTALASTPRCPLSRSDPLGAKCFLSVVVNATVGRFTGPRLRSEGVLQRYCRVCRV